MDVDQEAVEWLEPMEALTALEAHFGAVAAKELIADKLKDGTVRAKAGKMWASNEPTLNAAWKKRATANADSDVIIQGKIWRSTRHWDFDTSQWQWRQNRFVITRRKKPADRTIMTGVKFAAADIANLIPVKESSQVIKDRGGRRHKSNAWAEVCFALIQLERDGKLNKANFPSKASLVDGIASLIGYDLDRKPLLSNESLKPAVSAMWERLIPLQTSRGEES